MKSAVAEAVVRTIDDMAVIARAADLLAEIWGLPPEQSPLNPEVLRALSHAGSYVAGAWIADELVGVSAGFLGQREGRLYLHSHISGVAPSHQGTAVGFALKQHQRSWALERDIDTIEWTFDPLVRRNAYFNLRKLGARVVAYEPDFYGPMRDAINAGDHTDRVLARWHLRGVERVPGEDGDAWPILREEGDKTPVVDTSSAPVLRAWIPPDVVELRQRDPEAAARWREAVRDSVGDAIQRGYTAVDMSRDGWYTLVRQEAEG